MIRDLAPWLLAWATLSCLVWGVIGLIRSRHEDDRPFKEDL